jgi:hypothetical protein
LGILIAAAVILLTVSSKLPPVQNSFTDWLGLIQRTIIVPFMLWVFIFALGIHRRLNNVLGTGWSGLRVTYPSGTLRGGVRNGDPTRLHPGDATPADAPAVASSYRSKEHQ